MAKENGQQAKPAQPALPAIHKTREGWLAAALPLIHAYAVGKWSATQVDQGGKKKKAAWVEALAGVEPTELDKIKVTTGFPSKHALRNKAQRIGEAWSDSCAEDGSRQIIVSIVLHEELRILDVLLHEVIHAVLPHGHGHQGPFPVLAKACGLEGKMTATVASEELQAHLKRLLPGLGSYPHTKFDPRGDHKKQSTRLVKATCGGCGMIIRTTSKWIDQVGLPICACGEDFKEA